MIERIAADAGVSKVTVYNQFGGHFGVQFSNRPAHCKCAMFGGLADAD